MSSPREAEDVKLISSIFSPHKELIDRVIGELEQTVGLKDWISPELLFDRTKYYAREMCGHCIAALSPLKASLGHGILWR